MIWSVRLPLCYVGFSLLTLSGACADGPSFAELLARAHAEAAVGHEWEPAGDNVTETFMQMMNLLPQATPQQLAEFQDLLHAQQQMIVNDTKVTPADHRNDAALAAAAEPSPPSPALDSALLSTEQLAHEALAPVPDEANNTKSVNTASGAPVPIAATPPAEAASLPPPQAAVDVRTPSSESGSTQPLAAGPAGTATANPVLTYASREMPQTPDAGSITPMPDGRKSDSASNPAPTNPPELPTLGPAALSPGVAVSNAKGVPDLQPIPETHDSLMGAAPARAGRLDMPYAASAAISPSLLADLFTRGQSAESRGDISAARRYYESAASQGLAAAAYALSRLYDPAYLRKKAIGGIAADPAKAELWNQRAAALDRKPPHSLSEALSAR